MSDMNTGNLVAIPDGPAPSHIQQYAATGGVDAELQSLAVEMEYAKIVAESTIAPQAYRKQPGSILIAWGLGAAMGLTRMESLFRIDVIQGKPSAAAELIAANVRKAGHRLELTINDEELWAEATITRGDDGTVLTIRRDMDWARRMGLADKENYVKQPMTMLPNRAITACARLNCSEALYGVRYTSDELLEATVQSTVFPGRGGRRMSAAALAPAPAAMPVLDKAPDLPDPMTTEQKVELEAAFSALGITDADGQTRFIVDTIGRKPNRSSKPILATEADKLIGALHERLSAADGS